MRLDKVGKVTVYRACEFLCRRTDYPKLGYIIHCLNETGIPSVQHGDSFHAPLLWVRKDCKERAGAILGQVFDGDPEDKPQTVDDVDDDDPTFDEYASAKPDPDLWGGDGGDAETRKAGLSRGRP